MGSKSASTLGSHSLSEDTAGDGGGGRVCVRARSPGTGRPLLPPTPPLALYVSPSPSLNQVSV